MSKRTPVINISGDEPESLIQLGKRLGKNRLRRQVFNVIYGRSQKPRSKKQIMEVGRMSASLSQQVQNQLNYLATNHLIVSSKGDGRIKDTRVILYERDETVRAHRHEIVRIADDKRVADRMITKRRPQIGSIGTVRLVTRRALKKRKRVAVLYLVANPLKSDPLRVDVEVARVQEEIRGSKFRDNIDVQYRPAANLKSIVNGLNDLTPQILHFSGHGNATGVAGDNRKIVNPKMKALPFELLAKALAAVDKTPAVVVLNSCESSGARKAILPLVDVLITMKSSVTDIAASVFAAQFYAAIASGQSVQSAFEQGKNAVEVASIVERDIPELISRSGTDARKLKLT